MDPIPRATLANTIAPTTRIGETAAVTPATAAAIANAQAAAPLVASTLVDISPLGQFLSGVALSRRQLLALQGAPEQASGAYPQAAINPDLLAVAQQLTDSFAQLQTSGIDASQLRSNSNPQDNLAQRYDLLSGDATTDTAGVLAQNGNLLTQAGLARIGIDLRGAQVDPAALQAAFDADRRTTLDALQQGTDVMAQVGAVLAQQQGQAAATAVDADLNSAAATPGQLQAQQQADAAQQRLEAQSELQARQLAQQQAAALAQRQREIEQQMENEELVQDLQDTRLDLLQQQDLNIGTARTDATRQTRLEQDAALQAGQREVQQEVQQEAQQEAQQASARLQDQRALQLQQEQRLQQEQQQQQSLQALQAGQALQAQQTLQTAQQAQDSDAAVRRAQAAQDQQRIEDQRSEREELEAQRVTQEQQLQQQAADDVDEARELRLQASVEQQEQLRQRALQAADEATQAQLDASEAQIAARAASERAQQLAREAQLQADAGQAATAQAQLAQQNIEAQQQAARNAAQVNPPPSSQDPSVAAAIAAYNLTNMAASNGLAGRMAAADSQRPLVPPVAAVEPAKPVNRIQTNIDSRNT